VNNRFNRPRAKTTMAKNGGRPPLAESGTSVVKA
jgi:hypothetical protein